MIKLLFSYSENPIKITLTVTLTLTLTLTQSVSSCEGYFIPSLITTTSFVAGINSIVVNKGQAMPLNMFSVIVGPP